MSSFTYNSQQSSRKLSFQEFHDACDDSNRTEWVNGRVVLVPTESTTHQQILSFLNMTLSVFVQKHKLGEVLYRFLMRLEVVPCARVPDLLFVSESRKSLITHTYLDGPADIAIEIVSPESSVRDCTEKLAEYQTGGVREYWLIDPERKRADFFEQGADRRYYPVPLADGCYHSQVVPGYWFKVQELWDDQLPDVLEMLRRLGVTN